jgi:hypothetical protein
LKALSQSHYGLLPGETVLAFLLVKKLLESEHLLSEYPALQTVYCLATTISPEPTPQITNNAN